MPASADQLKRKLRELKKLEIKIRFQNRPETEPQRLVWDAFFSTQAKGQATVKYPLQYLLALNHAQIKVVFEEYFYRVYFQNYRDNGLRMADVYDPQLLALLGLPAYAGSQEIKSRFRELAKRHHPDHGGDSEKFIELVEIYERLQDA